MTYLEQLQAAHKERLARLSCPPPIKRKPRPRIIWVGPPELRPAELTPPPPPPPPPLPPIILLPYGRVSVHDVLRVVASTFGVSISDLRARRRHKNTALIKHVAFYSARTFTGASLNHVGRILGGYDHTTVMHGQKRIERLLKDGHEIIVRAIEKVKTELEIVSQNRKNMAKDEFVEALEAAE